MNIPEPFSQNYVWKRTGTTTTLSVDYTDYCSYLWSNGSHQTSITVSQPGTYWVRIYNDCGEISDTIQVRDNVEIYRATTELTSNLNQVTWRVSDAQAQYISEVKVYRNNQHVGTAPYTDGVFTDDIGSENTQWQYHIVAVSKEGQNCPYKSYWKRTIHLDHIQGSQGNQILQWTPYEQENTPNPLTAYNVYDVVDGEPRLVMQVGNFTNVYSYNPADFEGYGTVAAVFGNKGIEDMAFSNMTTELLDVGEAMQKDLTIYPNPVNGTFTVEGAKTLTVFNTLGQAVATSHSEDRTHSFTLRSGIYFVKSDEGAARKIVVE
ncbi:MAG: T9SS type A sorting domain-containing protein [Bacteroidales bacterium]|nr:T9SS type A sorting domain-containing protein [Bacteroidales bacterium]